MNAKDIKIGGVYYAKINGRIRQVTVLRVLSPLSASAITRYLVRNHTTGRDVVKSCRQLRTTATDRASGPAKSRPNRASGVPPVHNDPLSGMATVSLLKYAAGQEIICPRCENVLDWKETAIVGTLVGCLDCLIHAINTRAERNPEFDPNEYIAKADITTARNLHVYERKVEAGAMVLPH